MPKKKPAPVFVRGYLRASADDQDATRAKESLEQFVDEYGLNVAAWYVENQSGTKADRTELMRLLKDSHAGDILLIEQVDRLTRLTANDWESLKGAILKAGVRIVSLDLPTSHTAITAANGDEFTGRVFDAMNAMMLDVLAAVARKDYDDRRRRQAQGIEKAQKQGKYKGRPKDTELWDKVHTLRSKGLSIREIASTVGCAVSTVQRVIAS